MAMQEKDKKSKGKTSMQKRTETTEQGAFTKKPWADSTTSEKVKGVSATAAAAGLAGTLLYHTFK